MNDGSARDALDAEMRRDIDSGGTNQLKREKRERKCLLVPRKRVKTFFLLSTPRIYCAASTRNLILTRSGK